jgi:hypothetical protein
MKHSAHEALSRFAQNRTHTFLLDSAGIAVDPALPHDLATQIAYPFWEVQLDSTSGTVVSFTPNGTSGTEPTPEAIFDFAQNARAVMSRIGSFARLFR